MTTTRRVAHTASFLQTFHTGRTTADRRAEVGAAGTEPQAPANPEPYRAGVRFEGHQESQAAAFVRGPAQTVEVEGWKVRQDVGDLTVPQAKFVISLARTRAGVTPQMVESLRVRLEQGFTKSAASQFITTYKSMPLKPVAEVVKQQTAGSGTDVPAGRYSVIDPTDETRKFIRVDRPTQGRWAGFTFVKVQASDELFPIRDRGHREALLAEVAKDTEGAERAYGQLLGMCSRCGRTLTNEESRAYGIGPECRKK